MQVSLNFGKKNLLNIHPVISFTETIVAQNQTSQPTLISLDISENQLNQSSLLDVLQLGLKYPAQGKKKVKFSRLILYNNRLSSTSFLNRNTFHLFDGIKELNLQHNELISIKGIEMIKTSELQRLTLNNNSLNDQQAQILEFMQFGQLRSLEVQKNKLTSVPFIYNKTLSKLLLLSLNENKITQIDLTFANFLKSLYKLYLNSNSLKSCLIGVCRFQNLKELDLSKNKIVSAEGLAFLDLNSNLQKLKLNANFITIGRFLSQLNSRLLTDLEMRDNFLVDMSSYGLRRCHLPRVNTLFLTKNGMGGSLATQIMVGLNRNDVVNLSLWSKSNVHHKISSYIKMKKTFKNLAFYDY